MATRRPLTLVSGGIQEIPAGDTLPPAIIAGAVPYAGTVPAGSTTPTITHNLGTLNVSVTVRDASGNEVGVPNQAATTNTVVLTFSTAPTTNQYTVTISPGSIVNALPGPQTLTDAATIATNAALGNHFRVTLGGNRTLGNPTNPTDSQRVVWELIQDGTGSRTITLDTAFALGTDLSTVTLTTTASKRDFLGAIYNSVTSKWYVIAFMKGF
jgi:hypothetical protein